MSEQQTFQGTLGTYEVQRKLGEGGFGETFLATETLGGREVVVKRLRVDRLDDWKAMELFERESSVLETLDHPNIPDYVDTFTAPDGGGLILVQEFIEGRTLRSILRDGEELDEAVMTAWFLKMLEVLAYLHALDPPVIHRDVNPNNIILREPDGEPFLIDFGTVQAALKSESTISSTAAGTFGYAPTEQFIGKAYPSSDLYGLAMTYLAVWTGTEPEHMPFANGEIQLDDLLRDRPMDGRLKLTLEMMVDRVAEKRPSDAEQVLSRLAALRTSSASTAPTPSAAAAATGSNPWLEAKARLERLDPESVFGDLSESQESRYVENCAFSPDGTLLTLATSGGDPLLDTETMTVKSWLRGMDGNDALGFAPDNSFLIAFNGWDERMRRYDLASGKDVTFEIPEELQSSSYGGTDAPVAISPDHTFGALGSPLALFDPKSGALIRRTNIDSEAPPCFSPDGSEVVGVADDEITVMRHDGSQSRQPGTCFAYSPNGRRVAVATRNTSRCRIKVANRAHSTPSPVSGESFDVPDSKEAEIRRLAFDPSGRWLAIAMTIKHAPPGEDWNWSGRVLVLDTETGEFVTELMDPSRRGHAFDDVYGLGFDAGSTRLFVHGYGFATLGHLDDGQHVAVVDFRHNRVLALIDANGIRTPEGFHERFAEKSPDASADEPFEHLAWRAACGEAPESFLEGDALDRFLDLRQRVEFLHGLYASHGDGGLALPKESDLRPVIEATRGLTHLMPWIRQEAKRIVAALPAFGGQQAVRVDHLLEAANALSARAADEREVLFEEMLQQQSNELAAREQSRAAKRANEEAKRRAKEAEAADVDALVHQAAERAELEPTAAPGAPNRAWVIGFGVVVLGVGAWILYAFVAAMMV